MRAEKYYAYFFSKDKQGICESWSDCEKIVKGKDARYRAFKSREAAAAWLVSGANYELKAKSLKVKAKLFPGIYFDAGTGRGEGVEISITDSAGNDLLKDVLEKKFINKHGKHLIKGKVTNNYGELLAAKYALGFALKGGVKNVFGDSKLVIDFWSKGILNRKFLPKKTIALAEEVAQLRKEFESFGGKIQYISGDVNPADLGFH
ncbi:MAG: ribonuclease H family protein [Candidatus Harrisonbacteria bacterium]|nr:ribonuclease H family protein [Candidatus Harrisonbacteria bacterium]